MLLSVTSRVESVLQFVTLLFVFIFVLVITYISTKYIAGLQKEQYRTGNIELVETLRISNNKCIQIIRIGNRYFCMAVCKDTVTTLGEVQKEDIIFHENNSGANINFSMIFEKMKHSQLGNKKQDTNGENRR